MSFFRELWSYIRERRKYWLLPIIVMMIFLGGLIVLISQSAAVAPFIYSIF